MLRIVALVLIAANTALAASPLPVWREPASPRRYLEASGRRSAMLGNGAGVFEAWLFPIKAFHEFRLLIQTAGSLDRVDAEAVASHIEVTPAATSLVYSHAAFTIRETLWAPLDRAAIVVELEVEASQPLTMFAQFRSDLRPMWPASLGGQYNSWLADDHAMLLAEPTRQAAAVIGSPAFEAYSDEGDHMLPDRPSVLRLKPFPAGRSRAVIVIAGGLGDSGAARKNYRSVLENLPALRTELEKYWAAFLERTTAIETPDATFNRALAWGRVAMEKGFACNQGIPIPGLPAQPVAGQPGGLGPGCGLIAGYGPSGSSERPGFGWYFGGDAFMNVPALLDYGDFRGARAVLEFLRERQRADGKMMHEMTMSAELMRRQGGDWFKLPYAYYHADTTPLYLVAARAYFRRSGDRSFLEQSWPSLKKAYAYCQTTVDDDGLMSNLKAGMAAVETGALRGKVKKDIYLEGFWLAALEAFAAMAESMKDATMMEQARSQLTRGRNTLNGWFSESKRLFPFGVLTDDTRLEALTDWPAVALAFAGLDQDKARAGADALARPELSTDWGTRWVATDSGIYNPLGYNDGSVWPFMTGYVIQAQYLHHRDFSAWQQLSAMAGLTGFSGPGYVPENMSGDRRQALAHAVPHQLFSTGVGVLEATISGMLGLSADAAQRVIRFAPHLPPTWDFIRIKGYRVGEDSFDFELRREEGQLRLRVEPHAAAPYQMEWSPALPAGARVITKGSNSAAAAVPPATDRDQHATWKTTLKDKTELAISFTGGVELLPDVHLAGANGIDAAPGERSSQARLIGGSCEPQSCKFTFAGLSGQEYELRYRSNGKVQAQRLRIPASDREFGTMSIAISVPR